MEILYSTKGQRGLPRWFAPTFQILKQFRYGTMEFALPDGRVFRVDGDEPGPEGRVDVNNPRMFARIMREGKLGFAESYLEGWFDSPDLQTLLDVIYLNNREITPSLKVAALARRYEQFRHWLHSNTRKQARKNISHHYDLGNDFYALWLDETMTYSSAKFQGEESLAEAQKEKYRMICEGIGVKQGDHLLEIGCGWGGFAQYAATVRGARVRGLTISRAQYDFAKKRMFEAGLNERVEIVMQDYRDEQGQYDGIASIEMFEAVGEPYWPAYFDMVRARLKAQAKATLQIITMEESLWETYRRQVDFIQKYIFPGGMLPSPTALKNAVADAGLKVAGSVEFGPSYSKTLRLWHRRFNEKHQEVERLGFDGRFHRMWNFYLASCAAGFKSGSIDVTQITLHR
ncbi:MAG: cyclopropane-fatty-acyl-phospholipid synthase family protein [Rhodobacteraceae bacterium]|nr:cyclopropane-fatty-acyl-phospholipid synthase family protein [Paracoccaceae bacterium]